MRKITAVCNADAPDERTEPALFKDHDGRYMVIFPSGKMVVIKEPSTGSPRITLPVFAMIIAGIAVGLAIAFQGALIQ